MLCLNLKKEICIKIWRNLYQDLDDKTLNENVNEQHKPYYKGAEKGLERWHIKHKYCYCS